MSKQPTGGVGGACDAELDAHPAATRPIQPDMRLMWERFDDVAATVDSLVKALVGRTVPLILFAFPTTNEHSVLCINNVNDSKQVIEFLDEWLRRAKAEEAFNAEAHPTTRSE